MATQASINTAASTAPFTEDQWNTQLAALRALLEITVESDVVDLGALFDKTQQLLDMWFSTHGLDAPMPLDMLYSDIFCRGDAHTEAMPQAGWQAVRDAVFEDPSDLRQYLSQLKLTQGPSRLPSSVYLFIESFVWPKDVFNDTPVDRALHQALAVDAVEWLADETVPPALKAMLVPMHANMRTLGRFTTSKPPLTERNKPRKQWAAMAREQHKQRQAAITEAIDAIPDNCAALGPALGRVWAAIDEWVKLGHFDLVCVHDYHALVQRFEDIKRILVEKEYVYSLNREEDATKLSTRVKVAISSGTPASPDTISGWVFCLAANVGFRGEDYRETCAGMLPAEDYHVHPYSIWPEVIAMLLCPTLAKYPVGASLETNTPTSEKLACPSVAGGEGIWWWGQGGLPTSFQHAQQERGQKHSEDVLTPAIEAAPDAYNDYDALGTIFCVVEANMGGAPREPHGITKPYHGPTGSEMDDIVWMLKEEHIAEEKDRREDEDETANEYFVHPYNADPDTIKPGEWSVFTKPEDEVYVKVNWPEWLKGDGTHGITVLFDPKEGEEEGEEDDEGDGEDEVETEQQHPAKRAKMAAC